VDSIERIDSPEDHDLDVIGGAPVNPHFRDIVGARLGRREVVAGGIAAAVAGFLATPSAEAYGNAPTVGLRNRPDTFQFPAVAMNTDDTITVPEGYDHQVLIPWGTPITGSYPAYKDGGLNTGAEQEQQVGMHHDGMHYFPLFSGERGNRHGLLCVNHEYIDEFALHPNGPTVVAGVRTVVDEVRKEIAAHGVSVVEIESRNGQWEVVRGSRYNRRITADTRMQFTGPVRGSDFVKTPYSPQGTHTRGTLNNCGHGYTPWETYLTCEENWAGYFVNRAGRTPNQVKYGVGSSSSRYRWDTAGGEYARFDVAPKGASALEDYRNEANTEGWIVEIDPFVPNSVPKKHTALGRFGHEGAWVAARPGRPLVVYMGDDATNQYVYKYVSAGVYTPAVRGGGKLLEEGTLFVATFNDDGTGEWRALELADPSFQAAMAAWKAANPSFVPFSSQAELLINTRLAADIVGATRMDRPEWGAIDPRNGDVYMTMTNNGGRSVGNAANPRTQNADGHIIRWTEDFGRHDSPTFTWDLFVLGGPTKATTDSLGRNPIYAAQVFPGTERQAYLGDDAHFNSPDGLWFDSRGVLWIQTDGYSDPNEDFGHQQMLAANTRTGEIKRFFTGPTGCEVTGVVNTPDNRTMFVNIQHPEDGSTWPTGGRPRSATVVVTRRDGGIIGE